MAGRVDHVGDKDVIDDSEESSANQKGNQNVGNDDPEKRAFDEHGAQQDLSKNNAKEMSPRDKQQLSTRRVTKKITGGKTLRQWMTTVTRRTEGSQMTQSFRKKIRKTNKHFLGR